MGYQYNACECLVREKQVSGFWQLFLTLLVASYTAGKKPGRNDSWVAQLSCSCGLCLLAR